MLYNLGIKIYMLIISIGALFSPKAKQFIAGRKNWVKLLTEKTENNATYLWVHCSSLGEFEQGRPLIEAIKKQFPQYKIVLTFFSPSGYEVRKNYALTDIVCYLPIDTKQNAKKFISIIRPEKAFFIKYEYWYHYINELKKNSVPLYLVSGIFRKKQQFFKNTAWGRWYRKLLPLFSQLFIQDDNSARLLQSIGVNNFTVSGDTRFDRVAEIVKSSKKVALVEKFKGRSLVMVAGSTWKPDEELLLPFINSQPSIKFIIAPHEVTTANINRLQQLLKTRAVLYSKANENNIGACQVLIIDSVGLLSSLYRYGNIAYIGGGFGVGIHNTLEAATYGLPIIFGPNYLRFKEAVDLVKEGGAFPVANSNDLLSTLDSLLSEKILLQKSGEISRSYVNKHVGATKIILGKVFNN
ncbi:MAG: 3-deoxy-D-manno-octulosonic acid transferase [Draconibacterium sp.]|nr:MAG: 3-deoxy-D-manno-octulosonic acid transferase [Draconibacterium sp.]